MPIDPGCVAIAELREVSSVLSIAVGVLAPTNTGRRKYEFTPPIDAKLHEIYTHPDRRTHLTVKQYAGKLGWLDRVVSAEPVLTAEIRRLVDAVAARYAGTRPDVLRLAVPNVPSAFCAKALVLNQQPLVPTELLSGQTPA